MLSLQLMLAVGSLNLHIMGFPPAVVGTASHCKLYLSSQQLDSL